MNKFMTWLSDSFTPKMKKVIAIPWIAAVADAMQKIIPFILAGSVIFVYNVAKSYIPALPDLGNLANFTFGMLGVICAYLVASQAMEELELPDYVTMAGLTSVAAFMVNINPKIDSNNIMKVDFSRFGATGLMVAIITGLVIAFIFYIWSKLYILKKSNVPDFVVGWINTIIPILLSIAVVTTITFIAKVDIFNAITSFFSPLQNFGQTLPGFILLCLLPAFFYTLGISSWFFNAVSTPIYMAGITANIAAVKAGGSPVNIATSETVFTAALITMGGIGATLGLNLLMLRSKSKKLKTLARICLVPSVFNINEPLMFSTPVVMNPLLMIPMWVNSIVGPIIIWIVMKADLLNIPAKMIQVGQIPAPFSSVMITQDFRAIAVWAVLLVIYLLIWYPFFKVYEKQQIQEEQGQNA